MPQHDFVIADQLAPDFRADLNDALKALGTLSAGFSEPTTTSANMLWYDVSNNILKMRTEANDDWIDIGTLNQSTNTFEVAGLTELTQAQAEDDTDTTYGLVNGNLLRKATENHFNVVGSGPMYACRAWVNFNGEGTVSIRASGNVSSITDDMQGVYTVNFTQDMPNRDYVVSGSATSDTTRTLQVMGSDRQGSPGLKNESSCQVAVYNASGGRRDSRTISVSFTGR
jgi:hypothetical protein